MTKQTPEDAMSARFADEVRAELARQRKTAADLAVALGITQHTVGRRLNGSTPFNVIEMARAAAFLDVALDVLTVRAFTERRTAVAS